MLKGGEMKHIKHKVLVTFSLLTVVALLASIVSYTPAYAIDGEIIPADIQEADNASETIHDGLDDGSEDASEESSGSDGQPGIPPIEESEEIEEEGEPPEEITAEEFLEGEEPVEVEGLEIDVSALAGENGTPDASWYTNAEAGVGRTESNPYLIENADQLAGLAQIVNGTASDITKFDFTGRFIKLSDNIDLALYGKDNVSWNGGKGWIPIGRITVAPIVRHPFSGTFDGDGHTISGLYITRNASSTWDNVGLFGIVVGGTVRNLGLLGVDIRGDSWMVGGIAGYIDESLIENCYTTGTIRGFMDIGGIGGTIRNSTITGCYSTCILRGAGTINGDKYWNQACSIGGIVGSMGYSTVSECFFSGAVSGDTNVGGIAGGGWDGSTVIDCYVTGTVSGVYCVGGIMGNGNGGYQESESTTIKSCYSSGDVKGKGSVGGIMGFGGEEYGTIEIVGCIAFNPGITRLTQPFPQYTFTTFGRIAGDITGKRILQGNYAWNGIKILGKVVTNGTETNRNGQNVTSEQLRAADGFPVAFASLPWTYVPDTLPGLFGDSVPMPSHLWVTGTIYPQPPAILTNSLSGGVVGIPYNHQLLATSNASVTWTVSGGSLPTGLTLSVDGLISGQIEASNGIYTFIVKASSNSMDSAKTFSITITDNAFKVLEEKVTVNSAKTIGAAIPISALYANAATELGPSAAVKVYKWDTNKNQLGAEVTDIIAAIADETNRVVNLSAAFTGTRKAAVYKLYIKPNNVSTQAPTTNSPTPDGWLSSNPFSINITNIYPKITVSAGTLNAFYSATAKSVVTAKASDGSAVSVTGLEYKSGIGKGFSGIELPDKLTALKAGKEPLVATLDLSGYKSAFKGGQNTISFNATVTNSAPKLKLSRTKLALADSVTEPAPLQLLSNNKNVPLASWGVVTNIDLVRPDKSVVRNLAYNGADGSITLPSDLPSGRHTIQILFDSAAKTVNLSLTVSKLSHPVKTSISSKTKTIMVHKNHKTGEEIATIDVTPNAHNMVYSDWEVIGLPAGIGHTAEENSLKLYVTDQDSLQPTTTAAILEINSPSAQFSKPAKLKLSITDKKEAFTFKAGKGKIDTAKPDSYVPVSVKLMNTTSPIKSVKLLQAPNSTAADWDEFTVTDIGINTFRVTAATPVSGKEIVPGRKYNLNIQITLWNDQVINSWPDSGKNKPLGITPVQTVPKTNVTKTSVTLYKDHPATTMALSDIRLTRPANADIGIIQIERKSLDSIRFCGIEITNGAAKYVLVDGLKLSESSPGVYELGFENSEAPAGVFNKNFTTVNPAKASYKIKLEVWSEGTYKIEGGRAVSLDGNRKSKPAIITVTVNIK